MSETTENTQEPKRGWVRDSFGLIEGVQYKYTPDGRVDWRAMIPKEFLVVNKQNFKSKNLPVPTSIDGLEDKDLLILLGGIKYVAGLRGYERVNHSVCHWSTHAVGVETTIDWIPNFETDGRPVSFKSLADATENNTSSFARAFLSATAENRGFVRAVRNFLGINVCGQDEIGSSVATNSDSNEQESLTGAHQLLASTLENNNISFDVFQNRMIVLENDGKEFAKGATDWKDIGDVDSANIFAIIAFINEGLKKKKEKEVKK